MHSPHPKIFIQIVFLQRLKFPDPLFFKMPPRREKKQGSTMGEVSDLSVVFVVGDDQSLTYRSSPASTQSTCTRDCMESGSSTRRPGLSRRSRSLLRSRWEPRSVTCSHSIGSFIKSSMFQDVRIDTRLNKAIWAQGVRGVPFRYVNAMVDAFVV